MLLAANKRADGDNRNADYLLWQATLRSGLVFAA
jgi:hypothetical protein